MSIIVGYVPTPEGAAALDRAISELGSGTFSHEIVVSGPQDLERLLIDRQHIGDIEGMVALFEPQAVVETYLAGTMLTALRNGNAKAAAETAAGLSDEERAMFRPVRQSLVRRHPVTGRPSLYLSSHAGAIVGMAVPETERENELMGETRDNVIEGVQQTVREKVEKVQEAASNVVGQVQNAVGLTGDESSKQENRTIGSQPAKPGATDLGRS